MVEASCDAVGSHPPRLLPVLVTGPGLRSAQELSELQVPPAQDPPRETPVAAIRGRPTAGADAARRMVIYCRGCRLERPEYRYPPCFCDSVAADAPRVGQRVGTIGECGAVRPAAVAGNVPLMILAVRAGQVAAKVLNPHDRAIETMALADAAEPLFEMGAGLFGGMDEGAEAEHQHIGTKDARVDGGLEVAPFASLLRRGEISRGRGRVGGDRMEDLLRSCVEWEKADTGARAHNNAAKRRRDRAVPMLVLETCSCPPIAWP